MNVIAPSSLPDGHIMDPNVLDGWLTPYCSIAAVDPSASGTLTWSLSFFSFLTYFHDPSCLHSYDIK